MHQKPCPPSYNFVLHFRTEKKSNQIITAHTYKLKVLNEREKKYEKQDTAIVIVKAVTAVSRGYVWMEKIICEDLDKI